LRTAHGPNEPITVVAEKLGGRWDYRISLPDAIEPRRFVEAIDGVLLLEFANRFASMHSAEVPTWLIQGMAEHLLASRTDLILTAPQGLENGLNMTRLNSGRRIDYPLAQVQEALSARPPLTFEELSFPTAEHMSGGNEMYRRSAQLFVYQLLQWRDGPDCLRATLAGLPSRYNWQFALLDGFKPHFAKMLDVEKWWALQLAALTGRDLTQQWAMDESWRKLDEIIHARVQVRTSAFELPLRTVVSLQTVIREWDGTRQSEVIREKLQALIVLRRRVSQELIPLLDDYRAVIQNYWDRRGPSKLLSMRARQGGFHDKAADEAVRQLDTLDARRTALRPGPPHPVATATPSAAP